MKFFLDVFLIPLFVFIVRAFADGSGGSNGEEAKQNVSITKWQYCLSCKETVNLYIKLASEEIKNMQKFGKPPMTSLEATQLAHYICDHTHFEPLQPWMKYGCLKLMADHYLDFLRQFAGNVTINDMINKGENYKRKRRICGKYSKACHPSEFKKSNVTQAERTRCNGCRLVAVDLENTQKQFKKQAQFKTFLQEEYCHQIGYSFHPYLWMEEICEDIVEDHLKDVIDILQLQNGLLRTGLTPAESSADIMCNEFYKCPKKKTSSIEEGNKDDEL